MKKRTGYKMQISPVIMLMSALFSVVFFCACNKVNESPMDLFQDETVILKSKIVPLEFPLQFTGSTHFEAYALKEHTQVSDGNINTLDCIAKLTHIEGQNYLLETEEYFGTWLFRKVSFDVKISPGGMVMFSWPEEWLEYGAVQTGLLDIFKLHMGYEVFGPGISKGTINYKGFFDEDGLFVSAQFLGKQVQPGTLPIYQEMVEGTIKLKYSMDLALN